MFLLIYFIEQYPDFVAKLMELMPYVFSKNYKKVLKMLRTEERFHFRINNQKLLDYIKMFHLFSNLIEEKHIYWIEIREILQSFSYEVLKPNSSINLDFEQLTLSQIEDLVWWFQNIKNTEYSEYLKELLNYSDLLQYINSDYFVSK